MCSASTCCARFAEVAGDARRLFRRGRRASRGAASRARRPCRRAEGGHARSPRFRGPRPRPLRPPRARPAGERDGQTAPPPPTPTPSAARGWRGAASIIRGAAARGRQRRDRKAAAEVIAAGLSEPGLRTAEPRGQREAPGQVSRTDRLGKAGYGAGDSLCLAAAAPGAFDEPLRARRPFGRDDRRAAAALLAQGLGERQYHCR